MREHRFCPIEYFHNLPEAMLCFVQIMKDYKQVNQLSGKPGTVRNLTAVGEFAKKSGKFRGKSCQGKLFITYTSD